MKEDEYSLGEFSSKGDRWSHPELQALPSHAGQRKFSDYVCLVPIATVTVWGGRWMFTVNEFWSEVWVIPPPC